MAVEGPDQGYRAFEQRHDDRGVHFEGKRRRRHSRSSPSTHCASKSAIIAGGLAP